MLAEPAPLHFTWETVLEIQTGGIPFSLDSINTSESCFKKSKCDLQYSKLLNKLNIYQTFDKCTHFLKYVNTKINNT